MKNHNLFNHIKRISLNKTRYIADYYKALIKPPDILNKKKALESAVKNALKLALIEMNVVGNRFTEESLRYIVMNEVSKKKIWGTFPNHYSNNEHLLFEQKYKKFKNKNGHFKPDIVSIKNEEYLLAIELKITNDESDIDKCKEYINNERGHVIFDLAAAVYATPQNVSQAAHRIEPKTLYAKKNGKNITNSRLLIAYIEWEPKYRGKVKDSYKKWIRLVWI